MNLRKQEQINLVAQGMIGMTCAGKITHSLSDEPGKSK